MIDTGRSPDGSGSRASHEAASASSPKASIPNAGDTFTIVYPFVRGEYERFDVEGCEKVPTWTPGIRYEPLPPYGEDTGSIADGIGKAVFTVEAVFKPGRFPTRVFFTRQFINPDGKQFGKGRLHIVTLDKFRRLTKGYQHRYGIGQPLASDWNAQRARETFERMLAEHVAASAIETQSAKTAGLGPKDESAAPKVDAQPLANTKGETNHG